MIKNKKKMHRSASFENCTRRATQMQNPKPEPTTVETQNNCPTTLPSVISRQPEPPRPAGYSVTPEIKIVLRFTSVLLCVLISIKCFNRLFLFSPALGYVFPHLIRVKEAIF